MKTTNLLNDGFLPWTNKSWTALPDFCFVTPGFSGLTDGDAVPKSSSSPALPSTNLGLGVGFGLRSGLALSRGFATGLLGLAGIAGLSGFEGLLLAVSNFSKSSSILIENFKMRW